jgi:outer membrane protein OmpA-like peptidoglycan-associated protein
MRPHRLVAPFALLVSVAAPAHAEISYAVHLEGAAARMLGDGKVDQFGWGAGGLVAPELTLGDRVGIELPLGGVVLSDGPEDVPGLAPTSGGYGIFALPGVRLRPFGRRAGNTALTLQGVWLAGGAGMTYTGDQARFAVDARVGYDLFSGAAFRVGPSFGYLQIIESNDAVRPEDGRIVMLGIHGAFEPTASEPVKPSDRDRDGIVDERDRCPDDPEDRDGFEDGDGCPDDDNDADGLLDRDDDCPNRAEDLDGFEDEDGCPDEDNDFDKIVDKLDECPLDPEDPDGFEDEDGCPEDDNDGDGLSDDADKCPNEPETVNGYADDDGCPDDVLARVVGDEILLDERVYFHVNHDEVRVRSWEVLKSVADLLMNNPAYALVRIQGHADDTGELSYNQQLSERRSRSVRALLVRYGVDERRLVIEGFGEDRPHLHLEESNQKRTFARNKNRRVEFLILRRTTADAAASPSATAPREPGADAPSEDSAEEAPSHDGIVEEASDEDVEPTEASP